MNMVSGIMAQARPVGTGQAAEILEEVRRDSASMSQCKAGETDVREMAGIVVAAFRAHGHICNVMTHISGARWDRVEEALCIILDRSARRRQMTPLAENIINLLTAEKGVTGRIVKPYFEALLARILPAGVAVSLCVHVACLSSESAIASREPGG